jgi:tetratricopeptide (TPR) repeat protein
VHAYEQAVRLNPEYAWAHNGCGLSLKALGRLEDALMSFKRATRYQPDEVWHWYNVTEMLIDTAPVSGGAGPGAAGDAHRPHTCPQLGQAGAGAALCAPAIEEALEAYNRAIALHPDYVWAINSKGIVLEQHGPLR